MIILLWYGTCVCIYNNVGFCVCVLDEGVRETGVRKSYNIITRQSGIACSAVNSRQATLSQAKLIQP